MENTKNTLFINVRATGSCDVEIDYQVAQLPPCFLDNDRSVALSIPTNIPILSITGIGYEISGFPFLYGEEYYAPNIIDLTLIRARI